MDEHKNHNRVELYGVLAGSPAFSHESRGERFFTFPLETRRLSGTVDCLNIIARENLLEHLDVTESAKLHILGELRSFNNKRGPGSRLVITVFAREISLEDGEDINQVSLCGTICKPPNLRTTPMGRDICDFMLAVNRRYGRSDYLPCIAWGALAQQCAGLTVGDGVALEGRLQSRIYQKVIDGVTQERTAFEVSVTTLSTPAPEAVSG